MFDLNATLTNGGTLTGTIDLDLNASNFTSSTADITYTLGDVSSTISGDATALLFEPSAPYATGLSFGSVGDDLSFLVSTPSHASFANGIGNFCTESSSCSDSEVSIIHSQGTVYEFSSGTFTPAVPGPSCLALLSTGILGMAGVTHKRFA